LPIPNTAICFVMQWTSGREDGSPARGRESRPMGSVDYNTLTAATSEPSGSKV
jgi:hypothetical protein